MTLLLAPAFAAAQTAEPLPLSKAVAQALASHPSLEGARARLDVAQGRRRQASLALNPKLVLQMENVRPPGGPPLVLWRDTDNFAYLQYTLETARKRQLRTDSAAQRVTLAEAELALIERQIAARVAAAYWRAAGAARNLKVLTETANTFEQAEALHRTRFEQGAIAEVDLLRVQLESQRVRAAIVNAQLEADTARIALYREMGAVEFPPVTFASIEDSLPTPRPDPAAAIAARAESRLARISIDLAEAESRVQTAAARPNYDFLFGLKRTGGLNTMLGGFQVDLPFRNRNEGNIESSIAEVRVARSSLAATEALIRVEVAAATAELTARRNEVDSLLRPLAARAAEITRVARAAYQEGATDLLRLLDAERVRLEADLALTRSTSALRAAESALIAAMGELLP